MSKIPITFIVSIIVTFSLFLINKAGKYNSICLTIILLIIATGFCITAVLRIPWIKSADSIALIIWRGSLFIIIVLLVFSRFGIWIWPTKTKTTKETATPPIIVQLPSTGNLKQRAIVLSKEIMAELYRHGWRQPPLAQGQKEDREPFIQQMPTNSDGTMQWVKSRSNYFKFRFFERALNLRNEFAQLHLRDQRIDDFFKYQGLIQDTYNKLDEFKLPPQIDLPDEPAILPQQIEEVAEYLKRLAEQVK